MTMPFWIDITTGDRVNGPSLPVDLTNHLPLAMELMDMGLVRCRGRLLPEAGRLPGEVLALETTGPMEEVLALVKLLVPSPSPNAHVYISNLRSGEALHTTLAKLHAPPKPSQVRPSLLHRHPFNYTLADVCDASTLREQHHAIYGAWIGRDLRRLDLPRATKTLTFAHPQGAAHIRWATRHPVLGHRVVYLIAGWSEGRAQASCLPGEPVAWAPADLWRGLVLSEIPAPVLDMEDPDAVADLFGEFDLAEINNMRLLMVKAHGWNPLPIPRAWEGFAPQGLAKLL